MTDSNNSQDKKGQAEGRREQPGESSAKSKSRLLLLITTACALLMVLVWVKWPHPGGEIAEKRERKTVKLTGVQIAEQAARFLTSLTDGKSEFAEANCAENGRCELSRRLPLKYILIDEGGCKLDMSKCLVRDQENLPFFSWQMLAYTGLYQATRGENYKLLIKTNFDRLTKVSNGSLELFALHQTHTAYLLLRDFELLNYFVGRANHLRSVGPYDAGEVFPASSEPMLTAIAARQIALLAQLLLEPGASHELETKTGMGNKQQLEARYSDYVKIADRLIPLVEMTQDGTPNVSEPLGLREDLTNHSCWTVWAQSSLYKATNNLVYLKVVQDFFSKGAFIDPQTASVPGGTYLQAVLPCLDALRELSVINPKFKSQYKTALQTLLVNQWDYEGSTTCDVKGGFRLSLHTGPQPKEVMSTGGGPCVSGIRNLSDTSWAIYLFSQSSDVFEVDIL